jgi:integrase
MHACKKEKPNNQSSAYMKAFGSMRSFYVSNGVAFEKRWSRKLPKPETRKAIRKDNIYQFYEVDEEKKIIRFDRELMQKFLSNLKLRDQTITLSLLSSSLDTGDLFKLNVGDISQNGKRRILIEGNRGKTKVFYRTFLSREATNLVRRYLNQERRTAKNNEPLFVINHEKATRMTPTHLSSVYRDNAKRIGIQWNEDEWNPLRPKRLRHLFRTACDTAGVPELYVNAFMGHANSIGQSYSELSPANLELEYLRVEPFLTVYGEIEENLAVKEEVSKLHTTIEVLSQENTVLKGQLGEVVKIIQPLAETRKVLTELFGEEEASMRIKHILLNFSATTIEEYANEDESMKQKYEELRKEEDKVERAIYEEWKRRKEKG